MHSNNQSLKQSYDQTAEDYSLLYSTSLSYKPFDQKILDHFASLVGKGKICDIGCGPGTITSYLFQKSLEICGIDFSYNMIQIAKSLHQDINFYYDDAFHSSFENNNYEGITAFGLIANYDFEAINQIFKEAHRVLKSGGIFLFNYYSGQGNLFLTKYLNKTTPMNYYFYKKEEIQKALTAQGFTVDIFLEREPYKDFELQQQVGFTFARKTE